jgi:putative endonuclease
MLDRRPPKAGAQRTPSCVDPRYLRADCRPDGHTPQRPAALALGGPNLQSEKQPAIYILASQRNGTLYIGVTSDLRQRVWQHRSDLVPGFTQQYGVHLLVFFELHATMESAIVREKQLKKWNRAWKLRLIEGANPEWRDLWPEISML